MNWFASNSKRVLVGLLGWTVLLAGLIMVPYPGPGWIVVLLGLSILAREYVWAKRLHGGIVVRYDAWRAWIRRQPLYIKTIFWALTTVTVVVTIWLLNGYGLMNDWFNLGQDWVQSPIFDEK
jgi:uncharacterized protein (TIGR02611 family)